MSIAFSRYIDITSGVGAGTVVPGRDLSGLMITTNPLVPTTSFVSFTSASEVGAYFGTTSVEYYRAALYFGWVSKNITSPSILTFWRWVSNNLTAVAPQIFGALNSNPATQLAAWTVITNGSFGLTIAGVAQTFSGLNFTAAASMAAVAAILQTAVSAAFTGSTVVYDAARNSFDFTGGTTGAATITVQEGVTGTFIAGTYTGQAGLGWLAGAILSNGAAAESVTQTLNNLIGATDNFGSFLFIPSLSLQQATDAATWTNLQNVTYMFTLPVITANAATWSPALIGFSGVALTLSTSSVSGQYPEQVPMMVEAATDYTQPNATQNYMFQLFPTLIPSVTTDAVANTMDSLRINYIGQTQTNGQTLQFYQRGLLMGGATAPTDMNTFANEQWLKSNISGALATLLLSLSEISANAQGLSQVLSILQTVINQAVFNGVISVNKTLTQAQILYIGMITGDSNAWYQVQTIGYWVNAVITSAVNPLTMLVEYTITYTLIYSKDDVIRSVDGTDILI